MKWILLISMWSFCTSAEELLVLRLGESRALTVPVMGNIRVSSNKIVRVHDQNTKILLSGRKLGTAVVSHANGSWRVEVVDSSVQDTYRVFLLAIKSMKGLSLDVSNNQVLVGGELWRIGDWRLLSRLHRRTGGQWRFRASLGHFSQSAAETLDSLIASLPAMGTRLELEPYPRILAARTQVAALEQHQSVRELGLTVQADSTLLELEPAIRLRLTLAEVQNGATERLGVKLVDGQSARLLPAFKGPEDFQATLNFLKEKGLARLLATPSLTARSGQEAEFLSGGEFAVRSSGYRVREVSWKRHGLFLKFKPRLDPRGLVRLEIETEFSAPDYANQVDGMPSLRSSRAKSALDVRLGATVLLSGLLRQTEGWSASGPTGLSDIPLLGRLFRSEDFQNQRSQLQIFVTPELIATDADETSQTPRPSWIWND